MDDIMFVGMNIPKEVEKLIKGKESIITTGMNDSELKAYQLGITNTISALSSSLNALDSDVVVHVQDVDFITELDYHDLKKLISHSNCE